MYIYIYIISNEAYREYTVYRAHDWREYQSSSRSSSGGGSRRVRECVCERERLANARARDTHTHTHTHTHNKFPYIMETQFPLPQKTLHTT